MHRPDFYDGTPHGAPTEAIDRIYEKLRCQFGFPESH